MFHRDLNRGICVYTLKIHYDQLHPSINYVILCGVTTSLNSLHNNNFIVFI